MFITLYNRDEKKYFQIPANSVRQIGANRFLLSHDGIKYVLKANFKISLYVDDIFEFTQVRNVVFDLVQPHTILKLV